ncbi:hypothetical protein BDA96_01G215500 [Sorghum bicolor]|uniref:Uncharacterized protein n=2 Tax=Sorghum bicolor TaxID=4558 RepID=A0A921S010_SORBI|nr:hypothetical protein BDA96_01G215500 [Sorghum bicolor]OQU91544.1 hypothetical protein SORBI_3001G202133 [Sorghum bicolor]
MWAAAASHAAGQRPPQAGAAAAGQRPLRLLNPVRSSRISRTAVAADPQRRRSRLQQHALGHCNVYARRYT